MPDTMTRRTATAPDELSRWRRAWNMVATACCCAAGGSAGYAVGGPVLAVGVFAVIVVSGIIFTVIFSAMLGRRDQRSPFERLMLLLCVVLGRRPRDFLPP